MIKLHYTDKCCEQNQIVLRNGQLKNRQKNIAKRYVN